MINWIKIDENTGHNLKEDVKYIFINKETHYAEIGIPIDKLPKFYIEYRGVKPFRIDFFTHYAHINLPEE